MPDKSRDQVLAVLKQLLQGYVWKKPISEGTRLLHDLNIGSDDADEFLEEIRKKFGTRFDGFDHGTYFPNAELGSGEGWLRRMGFESPHKPLRVGHLMDVIMRGAWFDPCDQPASFVKGSRLRRTVVRGLAAMLFPIFFGLMASALGEWIGEQVGLARGIGLVLLGLPVMALLTVVMWRKLPAN